MVPNSEPRTIDAAHRHPHRGAEYYSFYNVYAGYQPHVVAKPKDVFVPIVLKIDCTLEGLLIKTVSKNEEAEAEANRWQRSPLERFDDLRPNSLADVGQHLPWKSDFALSQSAQKRRFRNDRFPQLEREWLLNVFLCGLSLSSSAIYVAGQNISLPTSTVQIMWRIAIVMMFSLVVVFWAVDLGIGVRQREKVIPKVAVPPMMLALRGTIALLHISIRVLVLVESFLCLRSLPASAYKTVQWPSFIAHI